MREIGNGLCFIQILEMVITNQHLFDHQAEAFFGGLGQPRPMRTKDGRLKRGALWGKQSHDYRRPDCNPILAIIQAALTKLKESSATKEQQQQHKEFITSVLTQQSRRGTFIANHTGGWLLSTTLERLHQELSDSRLLDEWRGLKYDTVDPSDAAGIARTLRTRCMEHLRPVLDKLIARQQVNPAEWPHLSDAKLRKYGVARETLMELRAAFETGPENGVIDVSNPKDFARFWSVCRYLFMTCDSAEAVDPTQAGELFLSEMTFFGDGWAWAGHTILYLCSLEPNYRLFDFTNHISRIMSLYPEDLTPDPKKAKKKKGYVLKGEVIDVKERDKPFVQYLLEHAKIMEVKSEHIMSTLKAHYTPPQIPFRRFAADF